MKGYILFLSFVPVSILAQTKTNLPAKFSIDSLVSLIPSQAGERFTHVFKNDHVQLFLYAPRVEDLQQPHQRDEFYIIQQGTGHFWCDGESHSFKKGDLLFAPAGKEHRFEKFSDDLLVYVIFYGDKMEDKETINLYLQAINSHNPDILTSLQSEDFTFIDAMGSELKGKEKVHAAWASYFKNVPDYKVDIESVHYTSNAIIIFGHAGGSLAGDNTKIRRLPITIRATVTNGKVRRWQVYTDTKNIK
ncbi:MAG: nuclear transport factor 2 family protein [Cytophagales bacterium]|nr:nuclear transport factor 2 family protein [Cytophagales bacterium]